MTRSLPGRWIESLAARARRRVAQLGRLVIGPDLHVTLVIARAAHQARTRRMGAAAGLFNSRTER